MPETLREATERLVDAATIVYENEMTAASEGNGNWCDLGKALNAAEAALKAEGEKRVFEGEWGWPDLIQERIGGGAYISLNLAKEMMQFDGQRVRITIEKLEDK